MKHRNLPPIVLMLFLLLALAPAAAAQQEQPGYKETFDDPTLPEWEHSREVVVAGGVLQMTPGSFALRAGDWSDITLNLRIRSQGEGEIVVNYYFRDRNRYGVILGPDFLMLEKETDGTPSTLAETPRDLVQSQDWLDLKIVVSGGEHEVYINDQLQLSATDPEPLPTGAVLLQVRGDLNAEIDDLEVRDTPGGPPMPEVPEGEQPVEGQPMPEGIEPPAGAVVPVQPAATPTAGSATGLGAVVDNFFASQASNLDLLTFLINLVLAAVCSAILGLAYVHWGASLSNRRKFAANFMLMTVTTTFIILIVRSSVALSLGLVGALSIVRFRTAVKEAEELAYLFFAIGLGIGLGDNQRLITLLALAAGIIIIGLLKLFRHTEADVNLHLIVNSANPNKVELDQIEKALKPHTAKLKLLRFEEDQDTLETAFIVEFRHMSHLNEARAALHALSPSMQITFLDNKGVW